MYCLFVSLFALHEYIYMYGAQSESIGLSHYVVCCDFLAVFYGLLTALCVGWVVLFFYLYIH